MLSVFLVLSFSVSAMHLDPMQDYWFNRVKLYNIKLDKPWKVNPIVIRVDKKVLPLYRQHWLAQEKRNVLLAPYHILDRNRELKKQLAKDLKDKVKGIKSLRAFYKIVTEKARYPELSFLDECVCQRLKRTDKFDDLRTNFENDLVNFYDEKIKKDVVYAAMGPGRLFTDLRLILLLLARGKNVKTIHLIDKEYSYDWMKYPLFVAKNKFKDQKDLSITTAFDLSKMWKLDSLIDRFLYGEPFSFGIPSKVDRFFKIPYLNIAPFFQLITFLTDVTGKQFDLYIHSSVDDYINFCKKNPDLKANFGAVIDYLRGNQADLYNFVNQGIQENGAVGWLYDKNSQKIGKPTEVLKFLLKEGFAKKSRFGY